MPYNHAQMFVWFVASENMNLSGKGAPLNGSLLVFN